MVGLVRMELHSPEDELAFQRSQSQGMHLLPSLEDTDRYETGQLCHSCPNHMKKTKATTRALASKVKTLLPIMAQLFKLLVW